MNTQATIKQSVQGIRVFALTLLGVAQLESRSLDDPLVCNSETILSLLEDIEGEQQEEVSKQEELFATRKIKAGEILTSKDFETKKPETFEEQEESIRWAFSSWQEGRKEFLYQLGLAKNALEANQVQLAQEHLAFAENRLNTIKESAQKIGYLEHWKTLAGEFYLANRELETVIDERSPF